VSYRDEVLSRLDIRAFFAHYGVELGSRIGDNEFRFHCPFHEDRNASANVNVTNGLWKCHGCQAGGGPVDFVLRKESRPATDVRAVLDELARLAGVTTSRAGPPRGSRRASLSDDNVAGWHAAALRNPELMAWFHDKRGYTPETVEAWELGWDGQRVTIPIRVEGRLVNVRRYQRDAGSEAQKMLNIAGAGEARIWPTGELPADVLLVEGEWDCILLRQEGFANAFTATGGAGTFKPEWVEAFRDRRVTVVYDNDKAGRLGSQKVARMLSEVAQVSICLIPGLPDHGDPTDFFVEQQRSRDELDALILDATPYLVSTASAEEPKTATRVPLAKASDARWQGQRLELPVLVSGKATTPYLVPAEFNVHCTMSNKRLCSTCPLLEAQGDRDVKLTAMDAATLSLVNVGMPERDKALAELAGAVRACPLPQVSIKSWTNIEEVRLIPELDADNGGDTEYVSRQGYFLGHGIMPNRGYLLRGYTHPFPKTQASVHLLSEAEPAQDNIGSFVLTPQVRDELRVFQVAGSVAGRFGDIYADLAANVHQIRDRLDMQIAYDLVWHSVIGFTFNGAYVRRGWVEGMVMSDSGQGKTEMAHHLLRHYRLGSRVQSEQSSMAGLLGGLEKMGDTWILGWGQLPQNDKRLLVIDEAQGLAASVIEALSDVRASGVAEITKIRTERTNARVRLLWLANPVSGRTLAQHNQGVLAISELMTKPEDIRRLDFALCLASGDVDFARSINVAHGVVGDPRYSSEACRSLVLWAWSRRPDQIVFTPQATDQILSAATDMGLRYHASIPLVEPSDQRLKLARLAIAAAVRVYSTDETGELVVVQREHVAFIVDYLARIYNARAMAYGEYSGQQRRGEQLTPDETQGARGTFAIWDNSAEALAFFRTATTFRKSDLEDVVGWDTDYAKQQIRWLTSHQLIRQTRNGFVKRPAFIALLRDDLDPPDYRADLAEAEF
jgi:hypothetical protein